MAAQRHDTPQAGTRRFGDRLRQARVRAHLSQAALAERIRVSRVIIASYETGKAAPELSRAVL
ncbi:MAG: helix-turn-helix transcriptional regulator [Gammaproteobacteria bacterium]|nr:helix-turn-helix transcriptional regulator [Gammaproteobacteria bacterium]